MGIAVMTVQARPLAFKIVVIDDDPTGSQTVHSCPLLLRWGQETLRQGLRHPAPLLFVLANTRALSLSEAAERNREIVEALAAAMAAEGLCPDQVQLVSRGDSTLRGHGVLEPQVLAEAWQERFEPVDATLHVPAFLPGGAHHRGWGASPAWGPCSHHCVCPRPVVWLQHQ